MVLPEPVWEQSVASLHAETGTNALAWIAVGRDNPSFWRSFFNDSWILKSLNQYSVNSGDWRKKDEGRLRKRRICPHFHMTKKKKCMCEVKLMK